MDLPVVERTRRLLATRPHHRSEPWTTNYLTSAFLAYALGLTTECPSDRDFQHAYNPGRARSSDYPTEARHTPLALAYAAALRAQGRDEDADTLLTGPEPFAPAVEAEGETDPPDAPPEPAEGDAEPPAEEPDAPEEPAEPTATPLPADFPLREALVDAGYETVEAVDAATDAAILAINGVGDAKLSLIRAAVTETTS